jgi:GDPmannose 4,6-dehydratase
MVKVAFLTGITGQDGSYLTEFLLDKQYDVWGMIRRASNINTDRIDHLFHNKHLFLRYGDLIDQGNISKILTEIKDNYGDDLERLEIYNLGAMSHVKVSFEEPKYSVDANATGVLHLLESILLLDMKDKVRFYQASTSEMFGFVQEVPQKETTPFYPRSPYGCAKLFGYWITKNYRESYNLFACNGILFNHESPRRGKTFVTRKITIALGHIVRDPTATLHLGNIYSKRDWGHARDYVEGMWRMLQQDQPDDFVLATNETHTVKEFVEKSFALRGFDIAWRGEGLEEVGYDTKTGRELIFISDKHFRAAEVDLLIGDSTKARTLLGWEPQVGFEQLIQEMVDYDAPTL